MTKFTDTLPKVKIIGGKDPRDTQVFINDKEWSQWIDAIKVEFSSDELTKVTISLYANVESVETDIDVDIRAYQFTDLPQKIRKEMHLAFMELAR